VNLKVGQRLKSQMCGTQVVVIRAAEKSVDLTCGGYPFVDVGAEGEMLTPATELGPGNALGKRFTDETGTMELLIAKPGDGLIRLNGEVLTLKEPKSLPASD